MRVVGTGPTDAEWLPLEYFYVTPRTNQQGHTVLRSGQLITHVWLPAAEDVRSATYEVLQLEGLDWPLAAAAAALDIEGGIVRSARLVMGHVAPVPWIAHEAGRLLVGRPVNEETAATAGDMAIAAATPLSMNDYKVQLARTAVKRAVLKAAGLWEGA